MFATFRWPRRRRGHRVPPPPRDRPRQQRLDTKPRLAAIHSFCRFAAYRHPEHSALIAKVLAIPGKRKDSPVVLYLDDNEIDALLNATDTDTWRGSGDRAPSRRGRRHRAAAARADRAMPARRAVRKRAPTDILHHGRSPGAPGRPGAVGRPVPRGRRSGSVVIRLSYPNWPEHGK